MSSLGVLLLGGTGSRMAPVTSGVNKHMQAIYDKPLAYYSLSSILLAGIREIVVVHDPGQRDPLKACLGDGSRFGCSLSYVSQSRPLGIAHAISLALDSASWAGSICVSLGDNVFYGKGFGELLKGIRDRYEHAICDEATVFGAWVQNPSSYGVVCFDKANEIVDIVEKPSIAPSNYAVPGLYFYPANVCDELSNLMFSNRGELEITDLNVRYLRQNKLHLEILGRGITWFDAGSPDSLLEAAQFVKSVQSRQGRLISAPEEIAFTNKWLKVEDLRILLSQSPNSSYYKYLWKLIEDK